MRYHAVIPASRRRVTLLLAALVLPLATRAGAQVGPVDAAEGFLTPPTSADSSVFRTCVTALPVADNGGVTDLGCTVVGVLPLGRAGDTNVWMVAYRRTAIVDYQELVDSLAIDELLLVDSAPDGSGYRVLWRVAGNRAFELLRDVRSVERDGGLLVGYSVCLNGTGGCAEELLLGRKGWSAVDQAYLEDLAARVPDGWSLHKGRALDLATLRGVQPISRPGDPNCCPSGVIRFEVELRDGALYLVAATVETPADARGGTVAGAGQ